MNSADNKLESAPLGKLIFSVSAHSVLALLFYNLYSLSDIWFISAGVGDYAAGAASAAIPLLLVLSAVSTTIGTGGASVISRALGGGDKKLAADTAANVFAVYWFFGILVTVFGLIFLKPLLSFMGISGELMPYAESYARIIIAGSVTATGFSALIRAEGASAYGLMIWMIPLSLNIALDALFIFVFKWGVAGAAAATVLSQVVSVLMSLYFFFIKKNRPYKIRAENFKINFRLLGNVAALGVSSFIQQMSTGIMIVICNRVLSRDGGVDAVTAFGFAVKIQALFLVFQTGIVQGVQPVIGYNYSAENTQRVKRTVFTALAATFVTGVMIALCGAFLGYRFLRIFTDNEAVLGIGKRLLFFLAAASPLKGFYLTLAACYQSAGFKKGAVILALASSLVIQFPLLILTGRFWGLQGISYSFIAFEVVLFLLSGILMLLKKGKFRRIVYEKRN